MTTAIEKVRIKSPGDSCPVCGQASMYFSPHNIPYAAKQGLTNPDYPKMINIEDITFDGIKGQKWDEVHFCVHCKLEYYFENSSI